MSCLQQRQGLRTSAYPGAWSLPSLTEQQQGRHLLGPGALLVVPRQRQVVQSTGLWGLASPPSRRPAREHPPVPILVLYQGQVALHS